jgi:hypothetical protein
MQTRRKAKRKKIKDRPLPVIPEHSITPRIELKVLGARPCPLDRPAEKVGPKFRSHYMAYRASHDLRSYAGHIFKAASANDELFFKKLGKFLNKKPKWSPMNESLEKLLEVFLQNIYLQNSRLSDDEIREKFGWSKKYYRAQKKRMLQRYRQILQIWRTGWSDDLRKLIDLEVSGKQRLVDPLQKRQQIS